MKYIKVEDAVKIADEECQDFRGIFDRIKARVENARPALVIDMDQYEELREELYILHDELETLKFCLWRAKEMGDATN